MGTVRPKVDANNKPRIGDDDYFDKQKGKEVNDWRKENLHEFSDADFADTLGKSANAERRPKSRSTAAKGKKRPAEEETVQEGDDEDKEEVDVRDEAPSKRQKRPIEVGGRWQDFEQELELAGATPLVAPVTFQFADTALPLRFKG